MERIRWINHNGLKVLFIDFSNLLENKFLDLVAEMKEFQLDLHQRNIFVIYDISNTRTTPKIVRAGKDSVKLFAENSVERKVAIIGFNRMQRILVRIVLKDSYLAVNLDDALAWVEKQADKNSAKTLQQTEKIN